MSTLDPRSHEDVVFRYQLERRAKEHPQRLFASFMETGERWTWADLDANANRFAHALAAIGVGKGSAVALMAPNGSAFMQTLYGVTKLGALLVPINTAFRGNMLQHVLSLTDAGVLVCDAEFLDRFEAIEERLPVRHVVVIGAFDAARYPRLSAYATFLPFDAFVAHQPQVAPPDPGLKLWDPYGIIFTSGTTGPSKGVLTCYGQIHATVKDCTLALAREDDVFLLDLPLFHVAGLLSLRTVLGAGAAAAVATRFRTEGYWERVRDYRVTHMTMFAQQFDWLWNQPPAPSDSDHRPVRLFMGRYPAYFDAWAKRFRVAQTYSSFNATELSSILIHGPNPANRAATGKPRPGVTVRLVDEFDMEVPEGQPGELIVRTELPWELNLGYVKMPEATAKAWRNGWFHTGDLFVRDAEGFYYYTDRMKDSIRRRGENISSWEVEQAILAHPAVLECAVVAAPAELKGDDEVLAFVVPKSGADLDPAGLIGFLMPKLGHFMIPRYVEVVDSLPRNQSMRVLKEPLRERGIGAATWDREKAGIVVGRRS